MRVRSLRFAGSAGSEASREGMETLPGFPSTMSSPPPFNESEPVCMQLLVGDPIFVNNAG